MGLIDALIMRSMESKKREQEEPARQMQLEKLKSEKMRFDLETEQMLAEAKKKKAQQKYLEGVLEQFTPVEPEAGGMVRPGTPADAPQPGLQPMRGAIPQIPPESLPGIMSTLALMQGDPKSLGMVMGQQQEGAKTEAINKLFGGAEAPITGESVAANLIQGGARGDVGTLAEMAKIKNLTGLNLLEFAKQATPQYKPRTLWDSKTGQYYTARWDERVGQFELTPTGEIKKFGTEKPTGYKEIDITTNEGKKKFFVREDELPLFGGIIVEPLATTWEKTELPGGRQKAVRVPKYGQPGESIDVAPEKGIPPEQAGRFQLAKMGFDAVRDVSKVIINEKGEINRKAIAAFQSPIPIGDGRKIDQLIRMAIEAPIRAATGAVINEEELKNYMRMYGPSILDSDELIIDKMTRLFEFNRGFATKIDPTGELLKRVGEKLEISGSKKKTIIRTGTHKGRRVIEYSDGSIEYAD